MIRGFFRLIGLLLLAGGFIFLVYDGARSIADQAMRLTKLGEFWNDIHQASQQAVRTQIEASAPWLWDRRQANFEPAGLRSAGGCGHSSDVAVPAATAADRLLAGMTRQAVGAIRAHFENTIC